MGVKISALPTATQAEAASGLIPVVTDPNGDGNLITKHVTASSIGGGATVDTGTTPPSNPGNGDLWFDEGNAELYIYNTSINGWIQTNGGGGGGDTSSVGARAVLHCTRVKSGITYFANAANAWSLGSRSQGVASVTWPPGTGSATYSNNLRFTLDFDITDPIVVAPATGKGAFTTSSGSYNFPNYVDVEVNGRVIDLYFVQDRNEPNSSPSAGPAINYLEWSGLVF